MSRISRRRAVLTAAAALSAAALALTACTAGESTTPSASGEIDTDAQVTVRAVLEPSNLDINQTPGAALDQLLIDNVYQGLVSRTPEQEIVPALASEYEISSDRLSYTFTLREGVTFADGQPLEATDVVWSLQTRKDTPAWRDSARLANVSSITADGQTITLTLSAPDSTLLWNLTGRAGIIVKQGDTVDYKSATNGTGPFTVTDWRQGDSITLTRNDAYWGDAPKVAQVVFAYVPDTQAALSGALAGEFDVVTGFDATLKEQIEAGSAFTLETGESTDKYTLVINQTSGPLADARVRKAIRQAIDHDGFVEAVGAGQTLFGPIPSLDPGYEDLSSTAPYDVEAAKALLAEAGVPNLSLTLTIPSAYPPIYAQLLVSDLADAGITLTVNQVEFPAWLTDVYTNHDFELSFVNHTEARDFENWANPDYYFTYDNPTVQQLYRDSVAATDDATAADLLRQAARIVAEDSAADWLFNGASVVAVSTQVQGFPTVNVNERVNLAALTKSAG